MTARGPLLSRRSVLAGLAAGVGTAGLAEAPSSIAPPPERGQRVATARTAGETDALIARARLNGNVTYAVADAATGEVLDARDPARPMPPASTLKAVTAIYAFDRLGQQFRFSTHVFRTGPVQNGTIQGDLVLAGGGDPTLDTDRLADLAVALREAGITGVSGRFLVWAGALPSGGMIDQDQPDHVSYNPAFGGLNLNFNRVHFEWKPVQDGFETTMQARARRFSPGTDVARMTIVDRPSPVYEYSQGSGADRWTVARGALGRAEGARWLPVRFPALYTADVFRTLARSNGIVLKSPELVPDLPVGQVIVSTESDELADVVREMLRYSTNLTAEAAGMMASLSNGVPVDNLLASGSRMAGWAQSRFGVRNLLFRDHSGLGYGSQVGADDMVRILGMNPGAAEFLKTVSVPDPKSGATAKPLDGVQAVAKTGTLNFVSSLVGYMRTASGRDLVFAILTADTARRDAIPPELREGPPGARSWAQRSRTLQKGLLSHWAVTLDRV